MAHLAGQVTSRGAVTCGRGGFKVRARAAGLLSILRAVMELKRVVGQCAPLFFLAVTFDLLGFLVLLVGLAAAPQLAGRYYGDFLALTGAVFMLIGLGMWVMWYAGNLGVDGKRRTGFGRIARQLSSVRGGAGGGWKAEEEEEDEEEVVEVYVDEEEKKEKGVEEEKEKEKGQEEEEKEKDEEEEEEEDKKKEEEEEEEKKEGDGGKGEENGAYTNEAYEPTDNEVV